MNFQAIRAEALRLGFGDAGACGVLPFERERQIVACQPVIGERKQLRFAPQEDCPWAKSLLVLLWPYRQAALPSKDDEVFIDSYYFASNAAYHAARALEGWMVQHGIRAQANVSYPARKAAVRAGLGIIGHQGLLIHPEFGTRTVIILLAVDTALPEQKDVKLIGTCMQCGRCTAACPAGAIDGQGMSHPERCLRNFMMEGVVFPEQFRKKMGNKLIGCDNCQRVCPMQPARGVEVPQPFLLSELMTTDDAAFRTGVARLGMLIGRNAARPQRVRAQAALLAGNRKNPKDISVLQDWAQSDFEAVRVHAQWALSQMQQSAQGLDQSTEKR